MRFVAFDLRSYDTWRMRLTMTLLIIGATVFMPRGADAFERPEVLSEQETLHQTIGELRIVQSDGMSLSQAIQSVRNRTGGKVIDAQTKVQGGREVHIIKVLKDGKVKTHRVNGRRR